MAQKPNIPKGTRDFSPMEMAKRNYIFNTIIKTTACKGHPNHAENKDYGGYGKTRIGESFVESGFAE